MSEPSKEKEWFEQAIRKAQVRVWQQFMDTFQPAALVKWDPGAWSQPGMPPATVDWSVVQDPTSWTLPDLPPEPEWQYVEDFAGRKMYRRVWEDGGEQWRADLIGVAGVWSDMFSDRMQLRRAILRNRDMPVRRAADGGLVGWRYWTLQRGWTWYAAVGNDELLKRHGVLIGPSIHSPHRGTEWTGPTLSAEAWSDVSACEGHAGVHAALRPMRATDMFAQWVPPPNGSCTITGRVRGYGRYVLGTRGWRAERVVIDYLRAPAEIYDEVKGPLSERYQCEVRKQWR